ncbi:MAG: AmmeMemoRadiSam system radical SAM enzyme [bacterium]
MFLGKISRREFLKQIISTATILYGFRWQNSYSSIGTTIYRGKEDPSNKIGDLPRKYELSLTEAKYYRPTGRSVQCILCPKFCVIPEGETGFCRIRINKGRKLYTQIYGQPCSIAFHPMEQGPIFHAFPGTKCLGIATAGCNLRCKYCQNWQMSQFSAYETDNYDLPPESIISLAKENRCKAIVFAYTEPIVAFEYTLDVAKLAKAKGIKTILVTAGYVDLQPIRDLCKYMDVIRVDLKGFTEDFYKNVVEGTLQPVLMAIKEIHKQGNWLEIVDPLVPGFNDSPEEIKLLSKWIMDNLGPDVPLHFLRFFPAYKMRNHPPTSEKILTQSRQIAMESGLHYVYLGNMPGHDSENTFCPKCGKRIIVRTGYLGITENNLMNNKCKFCGFPIPGLWS